MRAANWKDYELIDTGSGERLERWGDILLIRPDPQIIWKSEKKDPRWRSAHARYKRSSTGGGKWEVYKKLPDVWKITRGDLTFRLKPMGFKHTGVFPEQAVNWDYTAARIRAAKEKNPEREIKILNLFGYTGAATLACMEAGAAVTRCELLAHAEFADTWTATELPPAQERGRTVFRGEYTAPRDADLVFHASATGAGLATAVAAA